MPDLVIHVARGEAQLGVFAPEEVRELLDTGFLKPSDSSWTLGMKEWRPLNETLSQLAARASQPDWRDSVVAGSTALSRIIGRRVGKFVANVKVQASGGQGALSQAGKIALEQYLPQFHKLLAEKLRDKPADVAREALRSDDTMRKLSSGLYHCLPRPLRRFVTESAFVGFCMEHRQKLLNTEGAATIQRFNDSTIQAPPPSPGASPPADKPPE